MMNHAIEGEVTAATLTRAVLGQHFYQGVIVRRVDGRDHLIGALVVSRRMTDLMSPGTRGTFFLHDIVGFKGLHGFTAVGAGARNAFPRLFENAFGALAAVNLSMLATLLAVDGSLRLLPALMAVLGFTAWSIFAASRQAIVHDFRFEAGLSRGVARSSPQRPRHQFV